MKCIASVGRPGRGLISISEARLLSFLTTLSSSPSFCSSSSSRSSSSSSFPFFSSPSFPSSSSSSSSSANLVHSLRLSRTFCPHSHQQHRHFTKTKGGYEEPEYAVEGEEFLQDLSQVAVPIIDEEVKQAMWDLHSSDPDKFTAEVLAKKYQASLGRIQAILFLMQKRLTYVETQEARLFEALGPSFQREKIAEVVHLYGCCMEEMESELTEMDEKYGYEVGFEGYNEETLLATIATEANVGVEQVKLIVEHVEDIAWRQEDLEASEEHRDDIKEISYEAGADNAYEFQETPFEKKEGSLADQYFPELFGDEDFERRKEDLLQKIKRETKATLVKDIDYYLKAEAEKINVPLTHYQEHTARETSSSSTSASPPQAQAPSRWKWAFRDTSESVRATAKPKMSKQEGNERRRGTIIRTRSGQLRPATPLEEAFRSWTKKPTKLDMELNRHRWEKYVDYDGDDYLTESLATQRREKHKRLRQQINQSETEE